MPHNGPFYEQGVYVGRITEQALTKNKKENWQVVLRFEVLQIVLSDGSCEDVDQHLRTSYMVITDKTVERVTEQLAVLGYDKTSWGFIDPNDPHCHSLIGVECELYCKHETYNNETNEKWSVNVPRKPMEFKSLEGKELRELDNLFGKALKAAVSGTKPTSVTAVKEPPPSGDFTPSDDDVPF